MGILGKAFGVLKEYEDYENRDKRLNKGHIDKMPLTKAELKIRRFLNGN